MIVKFVLFLQVIVLSTCQPLDPKRPNLLFIMTDQQRFDAIRRTQNELARYQGKLKIRTPHLDKLSQRGAYFTDAYTQCPVCSPARGTLFTGCTIERTGIQANNLDDERVYNLMDIFKDKIEKLETINQVLVEDYSYVSEYYGKWHIPPILHYKRNKIERAIQFNGYDPRTDMPTFSSDDYWVRKFKRFITYHEEQGNVKKIFKNGTQQDSYTQYPYTPIQLDSRYGLPTNTPLFGSGFNHFQTSQGSVIGNYSLSADYTPTYLNGMMALKSLDRLATQNNPFVLTVSFHSPHPPYVAAPKHLGHYWDQRHNIYMPPNVDDKLTNNAYFVEEEYEELKKYGFKDEDKLREWVAVYYALCQEIDDEVGKLLKMLDKHGITDNTMIVFTSDHGDMLGSHGMRGKFKFYEDSVKVPLFIAMPGHINAHTVVDEPVSHLDLFATILDYLGAAKSDKSDGKSLRRFIEKKSFNEHYDENVIVSEWDFRYPRSNTTLTKQGLDSKPAFLIKKGHYKLMMFKDSTSDKLDIMFNLENDPYEVHNLLGTNGMSATNEVIGKAEHLKCLLIEWMQRMDGGDNNKYYSDPKYNAYQGTGDINEVTMRRKWRAANIWVSDSKLNFGPAVWDGSNYVRNEYLYIGRTATTGNVTVSLYVTGVDSSYFELDINNAVINSGEYIRVKVSYKSVVDKLLSTDAQVLLVHDADSYSRLVPLGFHVSSHEKPPLPPQHDEPTLEPTPEYDPIIDTKEPIPTVAPISVPFPGPTSGPTLVSLSYSRAPTGLPISLMQPSSTPSSILSAVPTAAQGICSKATCRFGETCFKLHILFDEWPSDTSWALVDDKNNNTVLATTSYSDAYANSLLDPPVEKCLADDSSYTFTITDSYGDGLCGHEHHENKGCGYYKIFYDGELIKTGASYGKAESVTIFPAQYKPPKPMSGPTTMPTWKNYDDVGEDVPTIIELFSGLEMMLFGINRGRALIDGPGNPVLDKASIELWELWEKTTTAYVEEFYRSKADEWNIDNIKTKFTVTKQEITEGGVRLEYEQSLEYRIRSPVNLGVVPDKRDLVEGPFLTESQRAKYVQMLRKAGKDDNYGPLADIENTSAVQVPEKYDTNSDTSSLSLAGIAAIVLVAILSMLLICICLVLYCKRRRFYAYDKSPLIDRVASNDETEAADDSFTGCFDMFRDEPETNGCEGDSLPIDTSIIGNSISLFTGGQANHQAPVSPLATSTERPSWEPFSDPFPLSWSLTAHDESKHTAPIYSTDIAGNSCQSTEAIHTALIEQNVESIESTGGTNMHLPPPSYSSDVEQDDNKAETPGNKGDESALPQTKKGGDISGVKAKDDENGQYQQAESPESYNENECVIIEEEEPARIMTKSRIRTTQMKQRMQRHKKWRSSTKQAIV